MSHNKHTQDHPETLILADFLPYKLSALSNKISSTIATTYKDKFALSVTEWRIMAILGEFPGSSADEVSMRTLIEKSRISRAISKLLKRHLVARAVDANDRRKHILTLTAAGKEIYKEIVPVSYGYETRLLNTFSDEEIAQLDALLKRLHERAKEIEAD